MDNLRFCIKNTIECYPLLLLWCFLVVITNTAISVITTFLPKIVIEKLTLGENLKSTITVTVILTLAVAVLSGMKHFFEKYVYHHKYKMNTYYVQKVAIKGMTADYCNQETDRFRKLHSESFQSCNNNYSALTQVYDIVISFCSNSLGFLLFFGILTQLNVLIIVFLVLTTLASYYLNNKIIQWAEANQVEKVSYQQRTGYITGVSSDLKSAKDIRLYHMIKWLGQIYQHNIDDLGGWYKQYTQKVFGVTVCDSGLSMLRDIASYAYLLYLVMSKQIGVADFVLYFGVITGFSVWLGGMLGQITALKRINMSVNYLRTFLDYPNTYKRDGGIDTTEIMACPSVIELQDVSYRYEGSEKDALFHINLTIAPKEHLAIVGLNGAGKTTLVKLMCGLVDPSEGTVSYNSVDVKDYNRNSYYQLYSAVFQQFSILPVTFAEIVAETALPQIDRHKVEDCLRTAGLWDKVSSLHKGMDSEYGKAILDEGVELSGGEIQKLLFARALYRNTPVIILDEPTAALDPIAESKLYEIYNHVMKDRSAVFISHRLASTRFCDRIVLIADGSIVEEGTHEELLLKRGRYRELYETQAKYYRESSEEGDEVM
ncbi:MAG TPA: ABC transporter ATP-binding protein [Mobilitalea sp.]|nr:ABC transporter ATP-binding protein [Mobilitalea sp.]